MKDGFLRGTMLGMVLLCTVARGVQLFLFFDAESGFTTDGGWLSGVVVVLGILAVIVPALVCGDCTVCLPLNKWNIPCGLAALLGAVGLLGSAAYALLENSLTAAVVAVSPLTLGAYVFYFIATAAGGVSLLYAAFCHCSGKPLFAGCRPLCLFPVLAMGARALYLFAVFTPENSTFVNLLNLCTLVFLLGFFCILGRPVADKKPLVSNAQLLICGYGAAVWGLASCLPNLLCSLLERPCVQSADISQLWAVGGLSLYALVLTLSLQVERRRVRRYRTGSRESTAKNSTQESAEII